MAKYVGGNEYLQPKVNPIQQGILSGVQEISKQVQIARVQKLLDDPRATPIQKAMLLASLGHEKLGSDILKQTANQSALQQIQENLSRNLGMSNPEQRDRSWVPDMSGRTPTIRPNEPVNQVQPGAEPQGTLTQPGFTPNAPAMAARNATALNQPQVIPQGGNVPMGAPQATPMLQQRQIAPEKEIAAYEQAAQEAAAIHDKDALNFYQNKANQIRKSLRANEKLQRDIFASERDYASKETEGFRKNLQGLRESLPVKEQALQLARQALSSGDVGVFSGSNLARITGIPAFESAAGAGLNLAAKEFLVGNLSQVSARAQNRWLEQVMSTAFPRAGQSQEANETVMEGVQASYDLAKAKLDISNALEEQDRATLGYVGKDIDSRVEKALQPRSKEILDRLSYRTRVYWEKEKGDRGLSKVANQKVPQGTPLTRQMYQVLYRKTDPKLSMEEREKKTIERAKMQGYKIYNNAQVNEFIE